MELERERNCIPNYWELESIISKVLSCFCNKNIQYLLDEEKEGLPKKIENKKRRIIIAIIIVN